MCRLKWNYFLVRCWMLFVTYYCFSSWVGASANRHVYSFNWVKSRFSNGGAELSIPVGSNFKIICPQVANSSMPEEYYAIYWVPIEGFTECFLPNNADKQVFVICDKPQQFFDFTVEITIFSGTPGAKDFEVGKSYYIASYSTGTEKGLYNEYHGACKDYDMKINLTVTELQLPSTSAPGSTPKPSTAGLVTQTPRPTTAAPTTRSSTTMSTSTTTTEKATLPSSARPPFSTDIPDPDTTDDVISVPDNGNSGIIDISNRARTISSDTPFSLTLLTISLSLLHILYHRLPIMQR